MNRTANRRRWDRQDTYVAVRVCFENNGRPQFGARTENVSRGGAKVRTHGAPLPTVGERVRVFLPGVSTNRGTPVTVCWVDTTQECFGVSFEAHFVEHNLVTGVSGVRPSDGRDVHLDRGVLRPGPDLKS